MIAAATPHHRPTRPEASLRLTGGGGGSVHHTDAATAAFVATHQVEQVAACAPSASYKLALQWPDQVLPSPLVRPPRVQKDLAMGGPTGGIRKTQSQQKEY